LFVAGRGGAEDVVDLGLGFDVIPPVETDKNAWPFCSLALADGSSVSDLCVVCELHHTQEGVARVLFSGFRDCPPNDLLEGKVLEAGVECGAAVVICSA
jgi:hypothetical protein